MKKNILGIAELLLAAALTVGSLTLFKACGQHEHKYMACHWAQNAVTLSGVILTVSALLRIIIPDIGVKTGIALVGLLISAGTAIIPNFLINLCMMEKMRCHTVFKPSVTVLSIILALTAAADAAAGITGTVKANEHK